MPRSLPFFGSLLASVMMLTLGGCSSTSDTLAPSEGLSKSTSAARDVSGLVSVEAIAVAKASSERVDLPRRNAYVLLSGGGTPLTNNYSQYLQAKAVAAFFERECPPGSTWIFFGAGNREGATPVLGDARHELKREGRLVQSWEPGLLPRNRAATKQNFLRALREEILPVVRTGGTLFLFVGDHGELAGKGGQRESAITMWQLKQRRRSGEWYSDDGEILKVSELRQVLADGLGQGRVAFGMTQCHGGGFHELGIAREMTPPREWFVGAPPAWAAGKPGALRLNIAGFTATDEASPAAGCDADPDPERWVGYERYLVESLLGLDLMSGQPKGTASASFAAAHLTATLVDQTIDKPRATSEHYLEAWARLIEGQLASAITLSPKVETAIAAFRRVVDGAEPRGQGAALRDRQAQFARFTRELAGQVPGARDLILTGTRQEIDAALKARGERGGGRGGRRTSMTELRRAWSETLRPAWKAAVSGGKLAGLSAVERELEERLLKLEDDKRELMFPRGGDDTALMNELYWASGYAEPATLDRTRAEAMALWAATRRARIVAWAANSPAADVRAAAEKIGPGPGFVEEPPRPLSRKTALERTLFYRRVLAAWEFLETMGARQALAELQTLIEIERTTVRDGTGI